MLEHSQTPTTTKSLPSMRIGNWDDVTNDCDDDASLGFGWEKSIELNNGVCNKTSIEEENLEKTL